MSPHPTIVLDLAAADLERVRTHRLIRRMAVGRAVVRRVRTVWYDTEDQALRRRRLSVHLDQPAPGAHLGPRGAALSELLDGADPAVREALAGLPDGQTLRPLFHSLVERTTRRLAAPDGSVIRLVLETGSLRAAGAGLPIARLGLTLESGARGALAALVSGLRRDLPLRLASRDDAEAGYALLAGEGARPVRAVPVALEPDLKVEAVLERVLGGCLAHLLANAPAVLEGGADGTAPEAVHQMRVAMRRLRAALSLFRKALPAARRRRIQRETRWLARRLGAARDWDVFLAETLPPVTAALPDHAGLARLRALALAERAAAYAAMRDALGSERTAGLLIELRAWVEAAGWRTATGSGPRLLGAPIGAVAGRLLRARRRKLLRHGDDLGALRPEARHEARKDVKKLRYAVEFFADLYPGRRRRRLGRVLLRLQDGLGRLNDVATARRLLERLAVRAGPADPDLAGAAGLVIGWHAGLAERRLGRVDRAWARLHDLKPLGRR